MPKGSVPEKYLDLLERPLLGHVATIGPGGEPQVNPIWFLWENGQVSFSVPGQTVKAKNLQRNPKVALSIVDPDQPLRYVEVRGEAIEIVEKHDIDYVNKLWRKYTGKDGPPESAGALRVRVVVRIDSWSALG